MDADVIVVGAGLAGLRCAVALSEAGLEVLVLEAADAPGGRIRTDRVDGFLVDRGFQLLNPAYPAVQRWIDVEALGLQQFDAGVAARTDDGVTRLGHPLRAPGLLGPTAGTLARMPGDAASLVRWVAPLLRPRRGTSLSQVLAGRPDVSRAAALDRYGVDGLPRRVLDAFLSGVLLEDDGSTADRFVLLLVWMFVRGVPGLPAAGMQALPDQLAAHLGGRVRVGETVRSIEAGPRTSTVTTDRGHLSARQVVVATDAPRAHELLDLPVPVSKGVVTTWWSAPDAPATRLLHVDARPRPTGPLVNAAVVSAAAPTYAPVGQHLVAGSALLGPSRESAEPVLRAHAGDLLGTDPSRWEVVARHEVPDALPAQPAPYLARQPVAVGDVVVCGDHRDTGSIQGALVSGQRAADAVRARLA